MIYTTQHKHTHTTEHIYYTTDTLYLQAKKIYYIDTGLFDPVYILFLEDRSTAHEEKTTPFTCNNSLLV